MRIRILGPVEILDEARGRRIPVSGLKRAALLATLVVRAGHTVSVDRLIEELWGAEVPANAANALQAHVKRLRAVIGSAGGEGDRIVTRSPGYTLCLRPGETDAEVFAAQVARARETAVSDPDRAIGLFRAALGLWRGPAMDGCGSGAICAAEAVVLEENRLSAQEALFDTALRANRPAEIIGELCDAVAAHPLRERLHDLLMVALYRCDRQSEAIGVYDRVRRRLHSELGVEPGPALRATMQAILAQSPRLTQPETESAALSQELALLQRQLDTLARRQAALLKLIGRHSPVG